MNTANNFLIKAFKKPVPKEFNGELRLDVNNANQSNESQNLTFLNAGFWYFRREYMAEFLGTLILVLFGDGAVAQGVLNPAAKGSAYLTINLGFGLGLGMGVYVASTVSGAHLNPAITLANCVLRKFPWRKLPGYLLAQLLGGMFGAALVMLVSFPAIQHLDEGVRMTSGPMATAGIFATFPPDYVSNFSAFMIELVSTAFLVIGILGVSDPRHKTPSWLAPIAIGGVITAIGMCTGWLTGFALNPARDFGPRLFTAMAGWGTEPFTSHGYYFIIPIIAPILGALAGLATYDFLVAPPTEQMETPDYS
ncbi:glycerol channel [Entomophthora muscae]|uniref:Glycerol channel n=1 Tax=Entomophthora muscae TaxID=34485 RepID=A0ACC2T0X6_9FUNG|nr:glycerol channel [Entomophthora muscae]